jgi:membrane-associated phospholipid phosphatase
VVPGRTRKRRAPAPPVWPLAALALLSALALGLLYWFSVQTATGQRLDRMAFGGLDPATSPRAHQATSELLETISISSVALLGCGIAALALVRARPDVALGAAALLLGANLTTQWLKRELPRPNLLPGEPVVAGGSFPSGHVTVAMSLALALVLVVPPAGRALAAIVGGAYAAGVGIAVIALDWHRASDVLGGYLVACAWTGLVAAALAVWTRNRGRPARRASRGSRVAGALAAVMALTFLVVAGSAAARDADLLRLADDRTAFVAASIFVGAGAAVVALAVAALLRRSGPDTR